MTSDHHTVANELEPASGRSGFSFLHLSDIHFGQEKGGERFTHDDIKRQLVTYLRVVAAARAAAGEPAIDGILVTGDIAYSGLENEYKDARAWLDLIAASVGCDRTEVRVVPGNHDIDRKKISPGIGLMFKAVIAGGEKVLDGFLASEADREQLYARFGAYRVFANGYGCPLDMQGGDAGSKDYVLRNGLRLRFIGLNSALLCHGPEKAGELLLGARQRILTEEPGVEWIVLVHHPLSWLADKKKAWNYIRNRARILISGHEHKPKLTVTAVDGNGSILQIDSGAIVPPHGGAGYQYTFNIIDLALDDADDALTVTVHGHIWDHKTTRFRSDTKRFNGQEQRTDVLPCPQFASVKLPHGERPEVHEVAALKTPMAEGQSEPVPSARSPRLESCPRRFPQLRLRFFHELRPLDRLQILLNLGALPPDFEEVPTMSLELMALESLDADDKLVELEAAMDALKGMAQ